MYKSNQPRKSLILSLGALTMLTAPMHSVRADDTPPPPNPNSEVTGAVDVAKGVVQELEDELARHMNQTSFDASDYKAWNTQFRAKLDAQTALFAETLEAEVAKPLQPLTDQYQEILQDTNLRPDQAAALKQVQLAKINQLATTLAPAYQQAYTNLLKGVMGFLPVASFQLTGDRVNDHAIKNFGTIMFDIITLGIGMDFKHEIPAIREADFAYTINSMDGSAQPLNGNLRVAALSVSGGSMNVSSIDNDSSSFETSSSNILSSCLSPIAANYGDSGRMNTSMTRRVSRMQSRRISKAMHARHFPRSTPKARRIWPHTAWFSTTSSPSRSKTAARARFA